MSSMVLDGGMPRSRTSDPTTSVDAGRAVDMPGSQAAVLAALETFGLLADHELVELLDAGEPHRYTAQRLRSARAELVEEGLVEFSGIYRLTRSGRRAQVWQVASD